jgi:MFS family permease
MSQLGLIGRESIQPGLLTRERIIAPPGYNRWLVPPAALAVHLCIGMVYGLSVFWLPLSQAIGITHPVACAAPSLINSLFTTSCDWTLGDLKPIFTLGIVVLGASAAIWGGWLERAGPRKAGLVAAICWPGGLALTALGVYLHQLWLMWLGGGVIGGIGLGLGYISPVSTLIKWFPDRRGLATGLAIMGFGGGAMIGAPLATKLMAAYRTPADVGVWQTLLTMAAIYFVFLTAGAFLYRVVPDSGVATGGATAVASVNVRDAHKTPQFWLLWAVLCLNVSAGIGVLEMASPMLQEIFGGRLIGAPGTGFSALTPEQHKAVAAIAAGFIGFLSLFNILGRFFWASSSDRLGRKTTFAIFFLVGMVLYALVPTLAHTGHLALFAAAFAVVLSMYGGGFATIPAYLADVFGPGYVGAIHGRLLTAWSAAGLIGPEIVNDLRQSQLAHGVPRDQVYDEAMLVLAGLLVVGLMCDLAVRPVAAKWFTVKPAAASIGAGPRAVVGSSGITPITVLPWLAVGLPLIWGFWQTVIKAGALFN